ncbi:MAG: ribulose-phosphate 3-epimerase [bacterium]
MKNKTIKIAPSILSADFSRLEKAVKTVEAGGADLVHVDVMDGHFVPNITVGPSIVKALRTRTQLPLDVHLMIEKPDDFIDDFAAAGADHITVHVEACTHLDRTIHAIKEKGLKAGVALNPATPLCLLEEIILELDLVLIMSVNPGFGGQKFISQSIDKIRRLKRKLSHPIYKHIEVEVDGGITLENCLDLVEAGADILVSGSAIFESRNPKEMIGEMKSKIDAYLNSSRSL